MWLVSGKGHVEGDARFDLWNEHPPGPLKLPAASAAPS